MREFLDEYDYLIHLVKCAIHSLQPQELPENFDFERVYEHGVYHHVANIAFYSVEKLGKQPEKSLYAKWEACRDQAFIRDINQSYAAEEIRTALQNADIRLLEVQGTKIKPLYPQPEYRTMSDIDFIIDLHNLEKARVILQELGYTCRDNGDTEVDAFRPPNINIELHTEYFPEQTKYYTVMRPPFASVEETGEYDINEFYIYNMLHIAKHYNCGGCGIRRILDIYFLTRNFDGIINKAYVEATLKTAEDAELVAKLKNLANAWFGEGELEARRSETESYIMDSGLHGTKKNELSTRLERMYGSTSLTTKVKYFLQRLLGTKEKLYDRYPILNRYKILYPFCWLHRAFSALGPTKLKRLKREVKAVATSKQRK
jgi:hypothetical protein